MSFTFAYIDGKYESPCGYCKHRVDKKEPEVESEDKQIRRETFGTEMYNVPAQLYDDLIQFNWRRCGSLYYRPMNETMCCPQYAIRVPASKFKVVDTNHNRVLRKLRQYLEVGKPVDNSPKVSTPKKADKARELESAIDPAIVSRITESLKKEVNAAIEKGLIPPAPPSFNIDGLKLQTRSQKRKDGSLELLLGSSVAMQYSGLLRKSGVSFDAYKFAELLRSRLVVEVKAADIQITDTGFISFRNFAKEITPPAKLSPMDEDTIITEPKLKLVLVAEPAEFKPEEFELYREYQMAVHKDSPSKISKDGYSNFLCESSLLASKSPASFKIEVRFERPDSDTKSVQDQLQLVVDPPGAWFSHISYHLRYELHSTDGSSPVQLVAVSVLDALPTGLSSVYFMYYSKFAFMSPGVISALIEIELVKRYSSMEFYYLGYYIHGCSKMRYKGQFLPSEILCPTTLEWTPLDGRVRNLMEQSKYCKFSINGRTLARITMKDIDLNALRFLLDQRHVITGQQMQGYLKITASMLAKILELFQLAPRVVCNQLTYILLK
eukprot:Partr_v1_DN28132_c1_g1_i2_m56128 putative Involved in the post-translational conjugation of arginine to the N-terminal aspartate or glutamate of a protein. This arginylation is required for degradation of the protein via the ubiquitin pathway. Does not arginylate cysteine residues (By similarity)